MSSRISAAYNGQKYWSLPSWPPLFSIIIIINIIILSPVHTVTAEVLIKIRICLCVMNTSHLIETSRDEGWRVYIILLRAPDKCARVVMKSRKRR